MVVLDNPSVKEDEDVLSSSNNQNIFLTRYYVRCELWFIFMVQTSSEAERNLVFKKERQ